ncbi:MAG: Uncharacterised protein [Methanobacteriota archaeon]|jgi:hypothetical protein|nr:MAG: Uncharacterised protein [Euryarchaeota archaeon]|tara:strand:+ start:3814 stop:5643 length:1830 start_codon:yes stop_codon:yes gene_type:complete
MIVADDGERQISLPDVKQRMHIVGRDLEDIDAEFITGESELYVEYAPNLKSIVLGREKKSWQSDSKKSGCKITFTEIPRNTVSIDGRIEEIVLPRETEPLTIGRVRDHYTLALEDSWGAMISSEQNITNDCNENDLLIFIAKGDENKIVEIDGEWNHIVVIGDESLNSLTVSGTNTIRQLTVRSSPNLRSIDVRRKVLSLVINGCKSIESVKGFGDRLIINSPKEIRDVIAIGGFWHQAPEWYNDQITMLRMPHFLAATTYDDLRTCEDMGGICITPNKYDSVGGLCHWSSVMGIPIDELSFGVPIPQLIDAIMVQGKPAIDAFGSWCNHNSSRFEQYKAMRVLTALIIRGFDSKEVVKLRHSISMVNHEAPLLITESVNTEKNFSLGGKWKRLRSLNSNQIMFNEWYYPLHSVMPFGRLDLEIWLHSGEDCKYIGLDERTGRFRSMRYHSTGKDPRVRDLMVSIIAAIGTKRQDSYSQTRLERLANGIYIDEKIIKDPNCCEFLIHHLERCPIISKQVVKNMVANIMGSQMDIWCKVALLVAMIEKSDNSSARMALTRLKSSREISVDESKEIHAIAIAGRRAFSTGKAARPQWPYLQKWREKYEHGY